MGGSDDSSLPTHNNWWDHCSTSTEEHRFGQSANNPTQAQSFWFLWPPNLCITTHQLQVVGQLAHSWVPQYLQCCYPSSLPHGDILPSRASGSTTSVSQATNCLLGGADFLALDNVEELCQTILMTTGVRVALHYQRICHNLSEQAGHLPSPVKVIHIEVDKMTTQKTREIG